MDTYTKQLHKTVGAATGLAPLHPGIEHLRKEYSREAGQIFADLQKTLLDQSETVLSREVLLSRAGAMDRPWSRYQHVLRDCRRLLQRAMVSGGDNSVLCRLSMRLRRWKSLAPAHDPHVAVVMRAWEYVQRIYLLNEKSYAPRKPTILFIHGSGVGPFPVFNGLFRELGGQYNIAYFLYDHLDPIADISSRLIERWAAFRSERRIEGALRIVNLSYGTSIFRYAVLTKNPGLWQGSCLLEIAPVVRGSKYLKWLNAVPTVMPLLRLAVPSLTHWAKGVDGKEPPQQIIWAPEGIASFDKVIPMRLALVPERDEHLSSETRRHLGDLLGDGKFVVIKGALHDTAPGLNEVIALAQKFLASPDSGAF